MSYQQGKETLFRGKQHMCIKCDGIQSTALHHLKWPLKRRTSQRWDQAVSGLADLHDLEGELQEIRFLASLGNQIKLQQLQLNGRFASSAEQGRPVSSTVWVPLGVVVCCLGVTCKHCLDTVLDVPWWHLEYFVPFQSGSHWQLVLSASFSHSCREPKCGIVSLCEGYWASCILL